VFWFILVVMVVVLGAAALVALGAGGSLPEAEQDRFAVRLPLERPVNRQDIDELRFPMSLRGYRMDEVDDVLDRLGAELAQRDVRIAELETELAGTRARSAFVQEHAQHHAQQGQNHAQDHGQDQSSFQDRKPEEQG
jgi:DivIVA domain-containing protein